MPNSSFFPGGPKAVAIASMVPDSFQPPCRVGVGDRQAGRRGKVVDLLYFCRVLFVPEQMQRRSPDGGARREFRFLGLGQVFSLDIDADLDQRVPVQLQLVGWWEVGLRQRGLTIRMFPADFAHNSSSSCRAFFIRHSPDPRRLRCQDRPLTKVGNSKSPPIAPALGRMALIGATLSLGCLAANDGYPPRLCENTRYGSFSRGSGGFGYGWLYRGGGAEGTAPASRLPG